MSRYLDKLKLMKPEDDFRPTLKSAFEAFEGEGAHTPVQMIASEPVDPVAAWKLGMERLEAAPVPTAVSSHDWISMVEAASLFVHEWGAQAHALGWTAGDLFGLDVNAPLRRLDSQGAAFMCRRCQVLGVTAETITVRKDQAVQRIFRRGSSAPPAWEEPSLFLSVEEREKVEKEIGGLLSKGSKGGSFH